MKSKNSDTISPVNEAPAIPLDIFRNNIHNTSINCKFDAWLAFLSIDDPDTIIKLIQTYPEFRDIYSQIYDICRNMEDIMGIFSKELRIMDQNEIPFMMDEMKEELNHANQALLEKEALYQQALARIKELENQHA